MGPRNSGNKQKIKVLIRLQAPWEPVAFSDQYEDCIRRDVIFLMKYLDRF